MVISKKVLLAGLVASMIAMPLVSFAKDGQGEFESESHRSSVARTVKVRGVVTAVSATSITVTAVPRVEDNHNGNSNENGNSNTNGNSNGNFNGNTNSGIVPVAITLTINDRTIVVGKHNRRARVSDIQLGDRVKVRATSLTNGIALKIEDKAIRLIEVKGFFTNVNQSAGTFTVTRRPQGLGKMTNVIVDQQTLIFKKHVGVVTITALADSQHGKVMGRWNTSTQTLEARTISIK